MHIHPAFRTIFESHRPRITVWDQRNSTSALTTYTFSSSDTPELGSVLSTADVYGTNPHVKSNGRKMVLAAVHAEDAATLYTVDSVTLGGVAGTEASDRGGNTVVSAAIYYWDASSLAGITNSDVVVTFSEAVSSCAVVIMLVDNVGVATPIATGVTAAVSQTPALDVADMNMFMLGVATSATASGAETVAFGNLQATNGGGYWPEWLYEGSNSVMTWAGAIVFFPGYNGGQRTEFRPTWSGAGTSDSVVAMFY